MEQLEFDLTATKTINREKGPKYIAHTGRPDHQWIKDQFHDRYGFEPAECFEYKFLTLVGPVPERTFSLEDN